MRVVGRVGTGTRIRIMARDRFPVRVMPVLIVPVGDRNVCPAVAVSEDHLGWKGVGAVLV